MYIGEAKFQSKGKLAHRVCFTFAHKDFGDAKVTNFDNHLVLVK